MAKYAERADAESVRSAQLDVQLRATGRAAASATREVLSTRSLLVAQAVAAYTNGGAFSYGPGAVQGSGLVVAAAYAEAVAQRQQLALRNYRGTLTKDQAVFSDLSKQKASVRTATRLLTADRAAASAEQSSLRRTLGGVKGDLALAVADVERQQAAVQAEEEKALLQSLKQLPKPTQVMAAQRLPSAGGPVPEPEPTSRPRAGRGRTHHRRASANDNPSHRPRGAAGRRDHSRHGSTHDNHGGTNDDGSVDRDYINRYVGHPGTDVQFDGHPVADHCGDHRPAVHHLVDRDVADLGHHLYHLYHGGHFARLLFVYFRQFDDNPTDQPEYHNYG